VTDRAIKATSSRPPALRHGASQRPGQIAATGKVQRFNHSPTSTIALGKAGGKIWSPARKLVFKP